MIALVLHELLMLSMFFGTRDGKQKFAARFAKALSASRTQRKTHSAESRTSLRMQTSNLNNNKLTYRPVDQSDAFFGLGLTAHGAALVFAGSPMWLHNVLDLNRYSSEDKIGEYIIGIYDEVLSFPQQQRQRSLRRSSR